jgi:hypothetical protein
MKSLPPKPPTHKPTQRRLTADRQSLYRLYNLTWEEVRVIEPGFPLEKDDKIMNEVETILLAEQCI